MTEHFPLPWSVEPHSFSIYASHVTKKQSPRVADMRGWGYLTGKGDGALGLSDDDGIRAQKANAELIVKAVNNHQPMVDAIRDYLATFDRCGGSESVSAEEFAERRQRMRDLVGGRP